MIKPNNFNIRVYGVLEKNLSVLISDEIKGGTKMTKFPGGGLEFGEGLEDAVIREFKEELDISVKVDKLLYINEFLQVSAFKDNDQLLCVYYKVSQTCNNEIITVNEPFETLNEELQCFRWVSKKALITSMFTYPIDKILAEKLKDE